MSTNATTTAPADEAFQLGQAMGARRALADRASGRPARFRCPQDAVDHAAAIARRLFGSADTGRGVHFVAAYMTQLIWWR